MSTYSSNRFNCRPAKPGLVLLLASISLSAFAHEPDDLESQLFYRFESNASDSITGVGTAVNFIDRGTRLGYSMTTSLNFAEVVADGYLENYLAWEGAVRFGLFSKVSIYGEVGIDLTELIFKDDRNDHDDYYSDEYSDNTDAYIGVGLGFKAGHVQIDAIAKLRAIDSQYWEADHAFFSGVQFSLNF